MKGIETMTEDEEAGDDGFLAELLGSPVVPNAVNAYRDNNLRNELYYNETQRMLVASILMAIKNSPPESIDELLSDAEDKVSEAGLSSTEQAPLFMAIALGKGSYAYWRSVIGECNPPPPDSSSSSSSSLAKWQPYLDCNRAINYANLPFWVCATMEGAMLGYAQVNSFNFKIPGVLNALGVTGGTLTAGIASLGVSAGKVIYKWVPRVKLPKLDIINDFTPPPLGTPVWFRAMITIWWGEQLTAFCNGGGDGGNGGGFGGGGAGGKWGYRDPRVTRGLTCIQCG